MRAMDPPDYLSAVAGFTGRKPDDRLALACSIAQEKAQTLAEVWPLVAFLFEPPVDDPKAWRKVMKGEAPAALEAAREALAGLEGFEVERVESALDPLPERLGIGAGKVYQPIRVAITGTTVSPGIFESVSALGREETLARIDAALGRIASEQVAES